MKADPTIRQQPRAPGLYDEQLQRVQQEKRLLARKGGSSSPAKRAFFTGAPTREDDG